MSVAHAGLGLVVAGITATSAWQIEKIQLLKPGEQVAIAGYTLTFKGVAALEGPNYSAVRGTFDVTYGGHRVTMLYPEKRRYPLGGQTTTEAAIHTTGFADLYVVIGEADQPGVSGPINQPRASERIDANAAWATRIYYNPLVPWIWFGAVVMEIGRASCRERG